MLKLRFDSRPEQGCRILCLGSHADDIEIGCGGTILRLLSCLPKAEVEWVVFSSSQKRAVEARRSAQRFLQRAAKKRITVLGFRDSFFPFKGGEIKRHFEQLKNRPSPDIIFTHYRHDLHQDHRLICELTWNTFRNHLILEYEIPKYDGDLGLPNCFVELEEKICRQKVEYLNMYFATQSGKHWFDTEIFMGLMRLRGMEARSSTKYAEAFYGRKIKLM